MNTNVVAEYRKKPVIQEQNEDDGEETDQGQPKYVANFRQSGQNFTGEPLL